MHRELPAALAATLQACFDAAHASPELLAQLRRVEALCVKEQRLALEWRDAAKRMEAQYLDAALRCEQLEGGAL